MDFLEPILSIAQELYKRCEQAKANKKSCRRLAQRVKALEDVIHELKKNGLGQNPDVMEEALSGLKLNLESAVELVNKCASASHFKKVWKVNDHQEAIGILNERLNDAFQVLSLSLQVEQKDKLQKVFEQTSRLSEDARDRESDQQELCKLLKTMVEKHVENAETLQELRTMLENLNKPQIIHQEIREIKAGELRFDEPKKPFMKSAYSEVFKGVYKEFTVAIKRYTCQINTNTCGVRCTFQKEVETMRRFESPNILRMFGICVQDENGPNPNYLVVMEYCEMGSLREVLDSQRQMSWRIKASMSLDAAQGLYRLHQSEEKFKVHGCITSSKFLVAIGYRVKLAGFELAKTETSLRRAKDHENSSRCYSCPQKLEDVNHPYSTVCEMYSFGIVLWEIATRQMPLNDCTSYEDVYKKVCVNKDTEPINDKECPQSLTQLIDACRSYDRFYRPTAGVLVDKLRKVVEQFKED